MPSSLALFVVQRLRRLLVAQAPADLAGGLDLVVLGALLACHWERGPAALVGGRAACYLPRMLAASLRALTLTEDGRGWFDLRRRSA